MNLKPKTLDVCYVCDIRQNMVHHNCKDCIYNGKQCESIKNKYRVSKPYEVLNIQENYLIRKAGFKDEI